MCKQEFRSLRRGAFTLVELIVVIAVIVILASIAIPVFMTVKENQKVKKAESQIKIIEDAIQRFRDDFGDYPSLSLLNANYPESFSEGSKYDDDDKELNEGNEILVACLFSVVPEAAEKSPYLPIALSGQSGSRLEDTDGDGWQELLDPWDQPYIYFPNTSYHEEIEDEYGRTTGVAVKATAKKKSGGTYYRLTSFQLWSIGTNRQNDTNNDETSGTPGDDDVRNWSD